MHIFTGAFLGALVGLCLYMWLAPGSERLDKYVRDCRAQGGWAVHTYWPEYKSWIQCMKVEAISLPADYGAKP